MLINRTHFSVRQAFSKPDDLVKRAKEIGLNYCGICDINTLAGVVEFVEACDKYDIMAIIGVTVGDRHIFARNYNGWKQLILLVSGVSDDISDCWVYDLPFIESRYVNESDEKLYRIIRAMDNKTTVHNLQEDTSNKFLIATNQDVSMFTKYSIFRQPLLPKFTDDEISVLRKIVFENFDRLTPKDNKEQYLDRAEKELKVIELNNLAGYFLIVYDFIKYARDNDVLVGCGRGCFLPDTRVKISNGLFTPISMIKIGDIVIDAYGNNQTVYDTMSYQIDENIIEIEFENNVVIRCTKDHKFLTSNRGFIEAQYLDENDDIVEV